MKKILIILLVAILAVSMLLLGISCKVKATEEAGEVEETTEEAGEVEEVEEVEEVAAAEVVADENYSFVLVSHGGGGDVFWSVVQDGMNDAAAAFGVDAVMQYTKGDASLGVTYVDTAIASEADGIGVVISDDDSFDEIIQNAIDAGIPTISFNTDDTEGAEGNARQAFIGQDFTAAGYAIGKRMIEVIPEGAKVLCPVEVAGANYAQTRYAGVKRALDEKNIESEMLDVGYETLADVLSRIESYLQGHDDVDAIIGLGGMPTEMAPKAIEELNLEGIILGGFDVSEGINESIVNGSLVATVDQQPYVQGFLTVTQLYLAALGHTPMDANTGLAIIDKTNVHTVIELYKN